MTSAEEAQAELLARRKDGFDAFLAERMPALADFAARLELEAPEGIIGQPGAYVAGVAAFMDTQTVEDEDFVWIVTRLGYLVGEVLVHRFLGCWLINEDPASRTFARYVVGRFTHAAPHLVVDPMEVAAAYVSTAPPRSLFAIVQEVVDGLNAASSP
jgi:hypothetical protein